MSRQIGNAFIAEAEPPDECETCGAWQELRPVGPNRERICISCADKNPETTARQMGRYMSGEN